MAQAEASASDAEIALQDAQEEFDSPLQPTAQDTAEAESVVIAAKIAVEDVLNALSEKAFATTELANPQRDLKLVQFEDELREEGTLSGSQVIVMEENDG